jgi:hypothetical protein
MSMSAAPGRPKQARAPSGGSAVHEVTSVGAHKLHDIALARSGDKGNRATLSVIALDPADFPLIERLLTAERVQAHFAGVVGGEVQRFVLPQLFAVHFVMHDALAGGVTRSLALDAHGKTLSAAILDLPLAD